MRPVIRGIVALLAAGLLLSASPPRPAGEAQPIARLETLIPQAMREAKVPGLSIALLRDGEVVWHRGFGVKNVETREPVGDETVFEAASLSKPVFAYVVLKLAERGQLDLDAPLTKYLPGAYVEDERLGLITARQVLSHTTGFPNWRPKDQPLRIHFQPGERFSYSGEGFVYLQQVVEHLSGMPLDRLARQWVFAPLGMTHSSYVWQDRYESQKAYEHNAAGGLEGRDKVDKDNAAASLHTTALDYARFLRAVLSGKGLEKATADEMLRPQVRVDETCVVCIGQGFVRPSSAISWGLGWGLQHTAVGDTFWHWGDNRHAQAYAAGDRKRQAGVVLFANSANGLRLVGEIVDQAMGDTQPALAWLKVEPYGSTAEN